MSRRRSLAALWKLGPRLHRLEVDDTRATVNAAKRFLDVFEKVSQAKVGASPVGKSWPADEITWAGTWKGQRVVIRTRPRTRVPGETFLISSNQRLRTSGHQGLEFLDVAILEGDVDDELETIITEADTNRREVVLRRGRFRR